MNDVVSDRITRKNLDQFLKGCKLERVASGSEARTLSAGVSVRAVDTWWKCPDDPELTQWEFDVVGGRVVNAYAGGPIPNG
jgi:hypothetical protein